MEKETKAKNPKLSDLFAWLIGKRVGVWVKMEYEGGGATEQFQATFVECISVTGGYYFVYQIPEKPGKTIVLTSHVWKMEVLDAQV